MNKELFAKLSAVEVKNDSRITETDRQYCEAHQQAYLDAKSSLQKIKEMVENAYECQRELLYDVAASEYELARYVSISDFEPDDIESKMEVLAETFIHSIVEYFKSTYKVSVSCHKAKVALLPRKPDGSVWGETYKSETEYRKLLRETTVCYEDILDNIFQQIGGTTFEEQAIKELKGKCHSAAWNFHKGTADYEIKGDTIRFIGYFCSYEKWISTERWKLCDGGKDILRGLAHFETGKVASYPRSLTGLLGYGDKDSPAYYFYDCEKAKQLKMFKNHRVDVKFSSKDNAERFATEYLGRVC